LKTRDRLHCENVSFTLGASAAAPRGHPVIVNLGYDRATGQLVEVAFCEAGKLGHGLHLLLAELGIKLSRCIQRRDPDTGAPTNL
jgi:hypothetical protein